MIKWLVKYNGRVVTPILFDSKEKAEDFAMIGFESTVESLLTWVQGSIYQKKYERNLEKYFKYEIVKCKVEEL